MGAVKTAVWAHVEPETCWWERAGLTYSSGLNTDVSMVRMATLPHFPLPVAGMLHSQCQVPRWQGLSLEASCKGSCETAQRYHPWWLLGTTEVKWGNSHFRASLKGKDGEDRRQLACWNLLGKIIDALPLSGSHSPPSLCHAFIPGLLRLPPCYLLQGQHRSGWAS